MLRRTYAVPLKSRCSDAATATARRECHGQTASQLNTGGSINAASFVRAGADAGSLVPLWFEPRVGLISATAIASHDTWRRYGNVQRNQRTAVICFQRPDQRTGSVESLRGNGQPGCE